MSARARGWSYRLMVGHRSRSPACREFPRARRWSPSRAPRRTARCGSTASRSLPGTYGLVSKARTSSTWTKLAIPPRTQGHPYNIVVLNDGTLVATYSARIATNNFQPSSGVFVSTTDGASWVDRSAAGMQYYTKDLTVDPYDLAQATWYAGVWGEWGASSGLGGLYCTTNRGVTWACITTNLKAVGSCTISPVNPDEMYVTTEDQGLWYSSNRRAATPV